MIKYEIKKIFSGTVNKIALLILAVMVFTVTFLSVTSVEYVDAQGNSSVGISAARNLRAEKNKWSGYVTEDVLQKVILENRKINNSKQAKSDDIRQQNMAYAKKQGFYDIRTLINMSICPFREYDYYKIDSLSPDCKPDIYNSRISNLKNWLSSDEAQMLYSKSQKSFLISQYKKLRSPLYYEDSDGWKALIEYSPTIIMLLVLIMGFIVSGIFSNEFTAKTDSILFSSKFGRNKAVSSKICAGFIITTAIYWTAILIYSVIVLSILGTGGAGCAIQTGMSGWKSFYNITFLQCYILTVLGGYLGNLFILALTMLISAKFRSAVTAVIFPFIILFVPSFISGIDVLSLSAVLGLLPDQLLQIGRAVSLFNICQIGGKFVGAVPIIFVLYSILYCVVIPLTYFIYKKSEVK